MATMKDTFGAVLTGVSVFGSSIRMMCTTAEPENGRRRGRTSPAVLLLTLVLALSSIVATQDQRRHFALDSAGGLRLHNVTAEPATLQGKTGIKVTMSQDAQRQFLGKTAEEQQKLATAGGTVEQLAMIEGLEFDNGVIEAEIAGAPMTGAFAGACGFVGVAFRLQSDMRTYDAFYLRPTNGRADDQVRRNHSAQYISHPEWTWWLDIGTVAHFRGLTVTRSVRE